MKPSSAVTIEAHRFVPRDAVGGEPALDFVNTVTGRNGRPRDWLDGYASLIQWSALVRLLPEPSLRMVRAQARRHPSAAAAALVRAKVLRECLFDVLRDLASGKSPARATLQTIESGWHAGNAAHRLCPGDGRLTTQLRRDAADLDLIASMVAWRAVTHVFNTPPARLRMCEGVDCAWWFIDTSKGGRRRWCDMAVCGNLAKSRRFHGRGEDDPAA
jgi:predicted RNA-binding Zn ribbon-like protein